MKRFRTIVLLFGFIGFVVGVAQSNSEDTTAVKARIDELKKQRVKLLQQRVEQAVELTKVAMISRGQVR